MFFFRYLKLNFLGIFLGIGLGSGFLTSLRFFGSIGISEIIILFCILVLMKKNGRALYRFRNDTESKIVIYFLFSVMLVLPFVTVTTYFLSDYSTSDPKYIISFIMGVFLMILLTHAIRKNQIDAKKLTLWFAFTFIIANLISLYVFNLGVDSGRYKGGANNPNQLLFYASTLSLMIIVYQRKLSIIFFPIMIFIMLKTKSDAYMLSLVLIVVTYAYLKVMHLKKINLTTNIVLNFIVLMVTLYFAFTQYGNTIENIWVEADEGDSRRDLMMHGLIASLHSPLFGFGAGSFSGISAAFQGSEAHNTFLDLSMQFGFIFPLVVYGIIFSVFFLAIKKRDYLFAAFIVGFIESGLFHFSGRHFIFWVELSIFMSYLFPINRVRD